MSGIDRTSGHVGMSEASRTASTMRNVGGAAFSVMGTAGSVAAGMAGGPLAGQAVAAGMSSLRSGAVGGGGGGGALGELNAQSQAGTDQVKQQTQDVMSQNQVNQMELFMLQQQVNNQSQAFNTLTNVQKSKHDAAMAAIQNTR